MSQNCAVEDCIQVKLVMLQHQQGNERTADNQQECLDNLYPGGGEHAAEGHIGDHQGADTGYGPDVVQTEQQLDQFSRAHELRDEIKDHGGEGTQGGNQCNGTFCKTERDDIDKCITAEIPQTFGDQE